MYLLGFTVYESTLPELTYTQFLNLNCGWAGMKAWVFYIPFLSITVAMVFKKMDRSKNKDLFFI